MEEVQGSSPCSSTSPFSVFDDIGFFFGGLVAGEGSFSSTRTLPARTDGSERRKFVFSLEMADRDRLLVARFREYLDVGSLADLPPRQAHHQPSVRLWVSSMRQHRLIVIPFMERYLLPSRKREQFEVWRDELVAEAAAHPKRWGDGPSTCKEDGCDRPVRGRG